MRTEAEAPAPDGDGGAHPEDDPGARVAVVVDRDGLDAPGPCAFAAACLPAALRSGGTSRLTAASPSNCSSSVQRGIDADELRFDTRNDLIDVKARVIKRRLQERRPRGSALRAHRRASTTRERVRTWLMGGADAGQPHSRQRHLPSASTSDEREEPVDAGIAPVRGEPLCDGADAALDAARVKVP